ncbi:unnamed protein product [Discosporangium mesarthrocarpum]
MGKARGYLRGRGLASNLAAMMSLVGVIRSSAFVPGVSGKALLRMGTSAGRWQVPVGQGRGSRVLAAFTSRAPHSTESRMGTNTCASGRRGLVGTPSATVEEAEEQIPLIKEASPKVAALRSWMSSAGVDAFIIPSDDPHLSEYVAECFNRRAFMSGFTGSAGTAVVLKDKALLWTDGRYHFQAKQELSSEWSLMKAGNPGVPTIKAFLSEHLDSGARVGIDPLVHSAAFAEELVKELNDKDIEVTALEHSGEANPVDIIWGSKRPDPPQEPVRVHKMKYAGETVQQKVGKVCTAMAKEGADVLVVCMLDEVSYLLNIRGDDVAHCPVTIAYALVTAEGNATLFVDQSKVTNEVKAELEACQVEVRHYEEALKAVRQLAEEGKRIWIDPNRVNFAFHNAVPKDSVVSKPTPISLAKGIKNEAELEGMRSAHVRDGVAMAQGLMQLEKEVASGKLVSEVEVDRLMTSFRAQQESYLDLSFPTIAGEGGNGAIIHYVAKAGSCGFVGKSSMLLLDSGAQYEDGTTDVTRTMHYGEPTAEQKEAYTRVLQGHIGLATATFPDGTPGFLIDAFARKSLWEAGLDYQHGTGHGVGAALNVHEGPHSISPRSTNSTPLKPGMIVSNEPGYYKTGEGGFGVRIENLLEIVDTGIKNNALGRSFYRFEPLTLIPIQKKLLNLSILTAAEEDWLNDYHEKVWTKISPFVEGETLEWLREATSPLVRS